MRRDLLPGVETDACPPAVVVHSRSTVVAARRRAWMRDGAHLTLLALVDYVAFRWSSVHIPLMEREESVMIVALLNAAVITHMVMARLTARLSARRIASTWSPRERARFFNAGPL